MHHHDVEMVLEPAMRDIADRLYGAFTALEGKGERIVVPIIVAKVVDLLASLMVEQVDWREMLDAAVARLIKHTHEYREEIGKEP